MMDGDLMAHTGRMALDIFTTMFLVPLLIVAGMGYVAFRRGREMKLLAEAGMAREARIVRKRRHRQSRYRVYYEYLDLGGETRSGSTLVTASQWRTLEVGSPFAIVFSVDRPDVSGSAEMVAMVRDKLAERGGRR